MTTTMVTSPSSIRTSSIEPAQPKQPLSLQELFDAILEMVAQSTMNSRKIYHYIFHAQNELSLSSAKQQAESMKGFAPMALKTIGCFLKAGGIVSFIPQIGGFLASLTKIPPEQFATHAATHFFRPFDEIAQQTAGFLDNHESAFRTNAQTRAEMARSYATQAATHERETDSLFQEALRVDSSVRDAFRSLLQSVANR